MIRLFGLLSAAVAALVSSAHADVVTLAGETMGSVHYTIRLAGMGPSSDREAIRRGVDAVLERINGRMSTYRPESELSQFNASTSTDWFAVSEETARVVGRAVEIAELSGGAFDPTVGRLVRLWSFGAGPRAYTRPDDDALEEAKRSVGYQHVQVRFDPPALRKDLPQVELDLSAIAKGYAVDAVAETLSELGIDAYMVEIGGEVRTTGTKEDGSLWRIAIERPDERGRSIEKVLELTDASLATSGDYRNYFEEDGVRYSHTIDPTTARPVTHRLASASILAKDCMTADALATTLMVLGPEQGLSFADRHNIAAYLITRSAQGGLTDSLSQAAERQFVFIPLEQLGLTPDSPVQRSVAESGFWVTVGLALGVFCLAALGLGAGVLLSRRPLRGSCGGMSADGGAACRLCSNPREECEEFRQRISEGPAQQEGQEQK